MDIFQLTHLLRGATDREEGQRRENISTHAPLARCDATLAGVTITSIKFQLTHLLRGATIQILTMKTMDIFQLTHLLRGATDREEGQRRENISTHAPLARCDSPQCGKTTKRPPFQLTHLLRGATCKLIRHIREETFQLTHLLRGATHAYASRRTDRRYFNSRTSCEVRPQHFVFTTITHLYIDMRCGLL